jgi:hypothetical protein
MRRITPLLFAPLLLLAACDEGSDDSSDGEFRAQAADGDVDIHNGPLEGDDDDDDDDCLIWDIDTGPKGDSVSDPDGQFVLASTEDAIVDSDGTEICFFDGNQLQETTRLRDSQDDVVLTVWRKWVFAGEVEVDGEKPNGGIGNLKDEVLFTFHGDEVIDGFHSEGEAVGYADRRIDKMSDSRKLLISALATGECGGPGWPD